MSEITKQIPSTRLPMEDEEYAYCMYCPMMCENYYMLRGQMMSEYKSEVDNINNYYRVGNDWVMVNDYIMHSNFFNAYYNIKTRYLLSYNKSRRAWVMWDGHKQLPYDPKVFLCKGVILLGVCSESPSPRTQSYQTNINLTTEPHICPNFSPIR